MLLAREGFDDLLKALSVIYEARDDHTAGARDRNPLPAEPLLTLWRVDVRGIPYSQENFHPFERTRHTQTTLATDASVKTLFECGTFKIVVSRVAHSAWVGREHIETASTSLRISLVRTEPQTREALLDLEVQLALRAVSSLGHGDFCLLDRSLMAPPIYRQVVVRRLSSLVSECNERGVIICGISKTSQLRLRTGEPLVGFLFSAGSVLYATSAWYYSPVFSQAQCPKWFLGQPVVVHFTSESRYAFRVDLPWVLRDECDIADCMGRVAYLEDPAYPGYPYPLIAAHKAATIHESEAETCRLQVLEALDTPRLRGRFLSTLRTSNYKREAIWHA